MACGIPLISSPWDDCEKLFRTNCDYLVAGNGAEMKRQMRAVLNEPDLARALVRNGLETIRKRHTCKHRIDELLSIVQEIKPKNRLENFLPELEPVESHL
jgi:spore maturation protein CgeB